MVRPPHLPNNLHGSQNDPVDGEGGRSGSETQWSGWPVSHPMHRGVKPPAQTTPAAISPASTPHPKLHLFIRHIYFPRTAAFRVQCKNALLNRAHDLSPFFETFCRMLEPVSWSLKRPGRGKDCVPRFATCATYRCTDRPSTLIS